MSVHDVAALVPGLQAARTNMESPGRHSSLTEEFPKVSQIALDVAAHAVDLAAFSSFHGVRCRCKICKKAGIGCPNKTCGLYSSKDGYDGHGQHPPASPVVADLCEMCQEQRACDNFCEEFSRCEKAQMLREMVQRCVRPDRRRRLQRRLRQSRAPFMTSMQEDLLT